ncbi:MAG: class I SAM-dependent methyltransferase [Hylemonella sp.]|nr:class I SAM-dependent methyltransferase [Hylemonella sp.]
MQSASDQWFDEAYYQRYYFDKKTSGLDPAHMARLSAFVSSYLEYLRVPVRRVLDVGCGIGLWRELLAPHFPGVSYHGVEVSDYLCARYGWERGSVVDYRCAEPFDLVICQGVLPYLSEVDLKRALRNLATLSRGALYVEAAVAEDYERETIDATLTDPRLFRHPARLYRRGLSDGFTELGGGFWLSHQAEVPLFELERAGGC